MMKLGPKMTGQELARFQSETADHLSFSLTLACPLRCAHCMVATVSPREAAAFTMPVALANRFALQMPEVAAMGIARVSFTGGEPFLARAQLSVLSQAAAEAGLDVTVVTACNWAKTRGAAIRHVSRFPSIHRWHISTDVFHTEFLDPSYLINAAEAVLRSGAKVLVRMAVSYSLTQQERNLINWVRARLPAEAAVALQPVRAVGRARDIGFTPDTTEIDMVPAAPCVTTGPLIRYDGQLMPCCSGLSEVPEHNPFAKVDAARVGLPTAIAAWRSDALLKLVRLLGFGFPASWAAEAGAELPTPAPRHPCDYCTALWASPTARDTAQRRANTPQAKAKIDELSRALLEAEPL